MIESYAQLTICWHDRFGACICLHWQWENGCVSCIPVVTDAPRMSAMAMFALLPWNVNEFRRSSIHLRAVLTETGCTLVYLFPFFSRWHLWKLHLHCHCIWTTSHEAHCSWTWAIKCLTVGLCSHWCLFSGWWCLTWVHWNSETKQRTFPEPERHCFSF